MKNITARQVDKITSHFAKSIKPDKQPLFIDVITAGRDPLAPPEQTNRINYNNPVSRNWLHGHMSWALNTGRTVHLAKSQS